MTKTIYIAGPMRGLPENNCPRFNKWAEALRIDGWTVRNPVEIGEEFCAELGHPGDAKFLDDNIDALMERERLVACSCDALFLLSGWERSSGARGELREFLETAGEIYTESVNLPPPLTQFHSPTAGRA